MVASNALQPPCPLSCRVGLDLSLLPPTFLCKTLDLKSFVRFDFQCPSSFFYKLHKNQVILWCWWSKSGRSCFGGKGKFCNDTSSVSPNTNTKNTNLTRWAIFRSKRPISPFFYKCFPLSSLPPAKRGKGGVALVRRRGRGLRGCSSQR